MFLEDVSIARDPRPSQRFGDRSAKQIYIGLYIYTHTHLRQTNYYATSNETGDILLAVIKLNCKECLQCIS